MTSPQLPRFESGPQQKKPKDKTKNTPVEKTDPPTPPSTGTVPRVDPRITENIRPSFDPAALREPSPDRPETARGSSYADLMKRFRSKRKR